MGSQKLYKVELNGEYKEFEFMGKQYKGGSTV